MKNDLLKIINNYGVSHQLKKLSEEVFELQEAVIQAEANRKVGILDNCCEACTNNVIEELSDVLVLLSQFKEYYDIDKEDVNDMMEYKINRQLERIEKGNDHR